jgi:hypothetical protein
VKRVPVSFCIASSITVSSSCDGQTVTSIYAQVNREPCLMFKVLRDGFLGWEASSWTVTAGSGNDRAGALKACTCCSASKAALGSPISWCLVLRTLSLRWELKKPLPISNLTFSHRLAFSHGRTLLAESASSWIPFLGSCSFDFTLLQGNPTTDWQGLMRSGKKASQGSRLSLTDQ